MSDLEDQLREARLAAPSDALDRRMDAAFAAATRRPRPARRSPPRWLVFAGGALSGMAATVIFFFAHPRRPVVNDRIAIAIVHPGEPQSRLVRSLLEPAAEQGRLPTFSVSVSAR